jgi:hypothetical protein
MVTFTAGILFLLFTCKHIWVWGILRRWPPTAENVRNTDIICGPIEAAYITVKTENDVRFLTRTAHVIGKCSCKKHIYETSLQNGRKHSTRAFRKPKSDFQDICINKLLINEI